MKHRQHIVLLWFLAGILSSEILAQTAQPVLTITHSTNTVSISRTGGTLQESDSLGQWLDLIEAPNPFLTQPTNTHQFFRSISRWSTRRPLLDANSEMSVAELNGRIYVVGGYPASRVTVRTVQVYDPADDRWTLTTPLPVGLNHTIPAVVNGKLYIVGGQTDSGNTSFVDTVYEFDPLTTNWTAKAVMPTARSSGAAAVVSNLVYVAGGRPPRGQDFAVYDVSSNRWTTLPNLPTGRNHLAAAAINGKIYVAGGRLGAGFTSPMTPVLEVYDPQTTTWDTLPSMPTTRSGVNGIAVDNCFFVWGGEGPDGVFDEMEVYVPKRERWFRLEHLPTAVHGVTGAAFLNGWIHAPGGGTQTGGSSGSTLHQVFWLGTLTQQLSTGSSQ